MKKVIFLLFLLYQFTNFSQEPQKPIFENIIVSCSVSYDCPSGESCFYTYKYVETNPPTNTATLDSVTIPVNSLRDDVILPPDSDDQIASMGQATSYHETYQVRYVPDNLRSPYSGPDGQLISIDGLLRPGSSCLYPDEYTSYKPPTIKTLWLQPFVRDLQHYISDLSDYRGIEPEEIPLDEVINLYISYNRYVPSLGPTPASVGSFEQWDTLISDVSKAKEIGWVYDNNLFEAINQRLQAGRQAAYDGNLSVVNTKLQEVIDQISASNGDQRKDEFYYLVYYNCESLKDHIPWPCEPKLTATPNYSFHHIGEKHEIKARLINQSNGYPLMGQEITMEVVDGPNMGTIVKTLTDAEGNAVLSYTGYYVGVDKIEVRTVEGTFAEKQKGKKDSQKGEKSKGKKRGSKTSRDESDCWASDKNITGLYAEWKGYIDFVAMTVPKMVEVTSGKKINLKGIIVNYGDVAAPPTTLRLKMSDKPFNSDPPPAGTIICDIPVDCLQSGQGYTVEREVTIPEEGGRYYFDACADPEDLVVEKAEWNNCASSIVSLMVGIPKVENTPPDCSKAKAKPDKLWPPNHKIENIEIEGITDKENDPFTITVTSITQDEPTNGLGDGDTSPDGFGVGTSNPQVRAERSGKGNGRVYQINFKAADTKGGECNGSVKVGVPHDKKDTPIDDGQNYDSTKP